MNTTLVVVGLCVVLVAVFAAGELSESKHRLAKPLTFAAVWLSLVACLALTGAFWVGGALFFGAAGVVLGSCSIAALVVAFRSHQPPFGWLSLGVLGAAAVIAVFSFLIVVIGWGGSGEAGLGIIVLGLYSGGILSVASAVIAVIGLARRERPSWPAITGFALSVLPAFGGVYLLCGAPW